jgi:hypothetical protein
MSDARAPVTVCVDTQKRWVMQHDTRRHLVSWPTSTFCHSDFRSVSATCTMAHTLAHDGCHAQGYIHTQSRLHATPKGVQ